MSQALHTASTGINAGQQQINVIANLKRFTQEIYPTEVPQQKTAAGQTLNKSGLVLR